VIFLLLGSNMGDRAANLAGARERLRERLGFESFGNCKLPQVRFSPEVRTEAIGFEGPFFLNQIVAFEKPEITPRKLLNICKKIEIEMGREAHQAEYNTEGRRIYSDRIIDIDILAFDEVRCDTKRLTLPHPQVWSRPFVMEIAELLPEEIFNHFQTIVNN
jgi:2-amino-4-hydroxy-6-hydroxymethyldihydropteridine diphosphokinase